MRELEIDFKANTTRGSYSWKIWGKCTNVQQLQSMKAALICYMDMKIAEAEQEVAEVPANEG